MNEADLAFIDVLVADGSWAGPPPADVTPFADVACVTDADVAEVSLGRGAVGVMVGVDLVGIVVLRLLLFEVGPVISSYSAA